MLERNYNWKYYMKGLITREQWLFSVINTHIAQLFSYSMLLFDTFSLVHNLTMGLLINNAYRLLAIGIKCTIV